MLRPERGFGVRFLQDRKAREHQAVGHQVLSVGNLRGIEAGGCMSPPAVLSAHLSSVCLPGKWQASSGCDWIYY